MDAAAQSRPAFLFEAGVLGATERALLTALVGSRTVGVTAHRELVQPPFRSRADPGDIIVANGTVRQIAVARTVTQTGSYRDSMWDPLPRGA